MRSSLGECRASRTHRPNVSPPRQRLWRGWNTHSGRARHPYRGSPCHYFFFFSASFILASAHNQHSRPSRHRTFSCVVFLPRITQVLLLSDLTHDHLEGGKEGVKQSNKQTNKRICCRPPWHIIPRLLKSRYVKRRDIADKTLKGKK